MRFNFEAVQGTPRPRSPTWTRSAARHCARESKAELARRADQRVRPGLIRNQGSGTQISRRPIWARTRRGPRMGHTSTSGAPVSRPHGNSQVRSSARSAARAIYLAYTSDVPAIRLSLPAMLPVRLGQPQRRRARPVHGLVQAERCPRIAADPKPADSAQPPGTDRCLPGAAAPLPPSLPCVFTLSNAIRRGSARPGSRSPRQDHDTRANTEQT